MRTILSTFGYLMMFIGLLLSVYDGIISFRLGSNQFLSVIKVFHYFYPGFISPFRFGFHGNELMWTDVLLPMFSFPVCLLLLLVGLMSERPTVRSSLF